MLVVVVEEVLRARAVSSPELEGVAAVVRSIVRCVLIVQCARVVVSGFGWCELEALLAEGDPVLDACDFATCLCEHCAIAPAANGCFGTGGCVSGREGPEN